MAMTWFWCGGEETSFPNGDAPNVITTAGQFRAGYARCGLTFTAISASLIARSTPFSAVTSAWISCQMFGAPNFSGNPQRRLFGVALGGTTKGLVMGTSSASGSKLALATVDGANTVELATEGGNSLSPSRVVKVDMQIVNYGASATVNVYLGGVLLLTFTGDVTVTGMSNFDSLWFFRSQSNSSQNVIFSEFIATDEDTRLLGLQTGTETGDGTVNEWTGAATDISEVTLNDATAVYTNTAGQKEQYALTALPSGVWAIKGKKVEARCSSPAGSTATKIGLGLRNGTNVNTDTPRAPGTAWVTLERAMLVDPTTGADFDPAHTFELAMESGS